MICKNCSFDYDDSFSFCPKCGQKTVAESGDISLSSDYAAEPYSEEFTVEEYASVEYEDDASYVEVQTEQEAEISASAESKEDEAASQEADEGEVKTDKKPIIKNKKPVVSKQEKKASMLTVLILCIIGVVSVCLAVLNIKTETFEADTQQPQKAVALTKLSAEEELVLEKELAECFTAFKQEFDSSVCDSENFVSRINPADSGNFYSRLCQTNDVLQTVADPAMRFVNEYGEYAYYKVEASVVEKLLARFNLAAYGDVNNQYCYYYDGYYYFNAVATKTTPVVSAEILKSKKVLDGSYYVECYFYVDKNGEQVKSSECYLIAEKNENSLADGYSFRFTMADDEPLFNDVGNPVNLNSSTGYTIETKIVEGKTDDGQLFCRYVIEYPVFSDKSTGVATINQFFEGMISAYELKASSAQTDYADFISKGGKAADLPFTETVITRVSYTDDEKISCVEKIATYSPELPETEKTTTESTENEDGYYNSYYKEEEPAVPEQEPVKLFTRTVEAYTFDKKNGDFVSKDAVLGKDYMVVSEILYRIYNSYDYTAVIPEEAVEDTTVAVTDEFGNAVTEIQEDDRFDYDEDYGYYDYYEEEEEGYGDGVPVDEYGFGTVIYESAGCFTKDGFTFYYVEDEGYVTAVTLPWEVIEKLTK